MNYMVYKLYMNKTTFCKVSCHHTSIRKAKRKPSTSLSAGRNTEQQEPSPATADGCRAASYNAKHTCPRPSNPTPGYLPSKLRTLVHREKLYANTRHQQTGSAQVRPQRRERVKAQQLVQAVPRKGLFTHANSVGASC